MRSPDTLSGDGAGFGNERTDDNRGNRLAEGRGVRFKTGYYSGFTIHMGYSDGSELTGRFDDNYLPGTRVMVYSTSSQTMTAEPDGWMSVPLETPFEYNGTDDLIVELEWVGGSSVFYTWMWETGTNRALLNTTDAGSPPGSSGR